MAAGQVWLSDKVAALFEILRAKLGGYTPILSVFGDTAPAGPAALHQPTLYPELFVPADRNGDWGEVARGITHLISSLDGVPELRVHGNTADAAIAQEINSELQAVASAKEGLPKPLWDQGAVERMVDAVLNPLPDQLEALRLFALVKLHRFALEGHPDAPSELLRISMAETNLASEAELVFAALSAKDLRSPAGKARAAMILLQALKLDQSKFYFQAARHLPGVYDDRSLEYYPARESLAASFAALQPRPGSWMKFQLPFAIPVREGIYLGTEIITLVRQIPVVNPRAGWRASQGARIETMMSPSGLYAITELEVWLPGALRIDDAAPPGKVQYKNIASYPEAVRTAVLRVNGLITGLRAETGRSDIPEVVPSDLNQLAYRQYSDVGTLVRDIPSINFELVKMSAGPPAFEDELAAEPRTLNQPSFARELLESSKFQLAAYNPRRAVLDLVGAFEAFVAAIVTPRLLDVALTTKQQFVRQYGSQLSEAALAEITAASLPAEQDPPRMPPVHRLLSHYKKQKFQPALNQQRLSRIQRVMNVRNDAAHGRPIPPRIVDELVAAIEGLDALIGDHLEGR